MKTVLCCGVFDLLHVGHIEHLQAAARMGDKLMVLLTRDEHVNKAGRPIQTVAERMFVLSALRCVNEVYVNDYPNAANVILTLKPSVFCKGYDYVGSMALVELNACMTVGTSVAYTMTTKRSTTALIQRIKESKC